MNEVNPSLKPFWTQRQFYLPVLVAAVLNGLIYIALTHRLATKQERLSRQHASLTVEVEAKRGELQELESESKRIARNDETTKRFWDEVVQPLEPGLTEAWADLKRLAAGAGLQGGEIGFRYKPLDVGLTEVRASMPLEGSYFGLVSFINALERSPRFFQVKEIRLSSGRDNENLIRLRCDVSFLVKDIEDKAAEVS